MEITRDKILSTVAEFMREQSDAYKNLDAATRKLVTALVQSDLPAIEKYTRRGDTELTRMRSKLLDIMSALTKFAEQSPVESQKLEPETKEMFEQCAQKLIEKAGEFKSLDEKTANLALAGSSFANGETDPIRQIVMLYDVAIKFLNFTAEDIENEDIVAKAEHSTRALDIIRYLQSILDFEKGGDVATALDNLYTSTTVLVLRASAELDPELMKRAAKLLQPVRDAWKTNSANHKENSPPSPINAPATIKVAV